MTNEQIKEHAEKYAEKKGKKNDKTFKDKIFKKMKEIVHTKDNVKL